MNVFALPIGEYTVRAVTSLAVDTDDICQAIDAVRHIMAELSA